MLDLRMGCSCSTNRGRYRHRDFQSLRRGRCRHNILFNRRRVNNPHLKLKKKKKKEKIVSSVKCFYIKRRGIKVQRKKKVPPNFTNKI